MYSLRMLRHKKYQGERVPSVDADFRPDFSYKHPSHYLERTLLDKEIMSVRQRFGMYSFFLSRFGMKKILDYFTHVYLWSAVDIDLHYIPDLLSGSRPPKILFQFGVQAPFQIL